MVRGKAPTQIKAMAARERMMNVSSLPLAAPSWRLYAARICLCTLAIAPLYPRLTAVVNGAAALALFFFVWQRDAWRSPTSSPAWPLRPALALFSASAFASAIFPHLGEAHSFANISISLHAVWNTLCSFALAWLACQLLRDTWRGTFLLIFSLAVSMVMTTVLLHDVICGELAWRVTGTKGGANRWSMLVFFSSFPIWMAIYDRQTIFLRPPRWFTIAGIGLALLTPFLAYRHDSFDLLFTATAISKTWEASSDLRLTSFIAAILAGLAYVMLCRRPGTPRRLMLTVSLLVLIVILVVAMSRSALLAFLVTCPALWFLACGLRRRRALVLLAVCALALVFFAGTFLNRDYLLLRFSRSTLSLDIGVRALIWRGAVKIFADHPLLGCGYGQESFRGHWPFPPPFPQELLIDASVKNFAHAHNLWLHLLATRGIAGFLAFMLLWAMLFLLIARQGRECGKRIQQSATAAEIPPLLFGMPLPQFIGLLALIAIQIAGIFELPLQEYNEIMAALPIGLGLAYLRADEL